MYLKTWDVVLLKDRFTAGFLAGVIGGIAMNVVDWVGYSAGLHDERLLDWAAVSIYGRLPGNLIEVAFAQVAQILFAGFLGVLFALMLLKLTSGNYLFKGLIYGNFIWFIIYAISIAVRLPTLESHTFSAVLSHFLSATTYGLVLSYTLHRLEKKIPSP